MRELLREIAMERELTISSGKVARDHVHFGIAHRPHQRISQIVQWLKEINSRMLLEEFPTCVRSSGGVTCGPAATSQ